ncbi:unnamed protein product [Mytilus edulis]|uniref:Uncharacterized protein n=1 Tax=Mytilus edulis TaxID=6550 RepID=A0A8S3V5A1_MYTED|nr:unnamed protein product [Mytilus edulis]
MDGGEPQRITVVTETRNLRTIPFIQSDDPLSTGKQWEDWLEGIEREFRYFKITQPEDKKDALLIYGGKELVRLEKSLKNDITAGTDEYDVLKNKINKYFLPKKNKHHSRYIFSKIKPERGEMIGCYVSRLREKANDCEFGNTTEERILEHCIQNIENKELIRKAISKGWDLDKFIEEAAHVEDTTLHLKEMRKEEPNVVYKVQNTSERRFERSNRPRRTMGTDNQRSQDLCNYCGFRHESRRCPAYGKDCRSCGKKNHFESMCRFRNKQDSKYNQSKGGMMQNINRKNVKKTVEDNSSEDSDQYEEDDYFDESVKYVARIGKVKSICRKGHNEKTVKIHLGDVEMKVEPDSGADVNVMDEHHFSNLRKLSKNKLKLEKSKTVLSTLQNSLPVKGEFKTIVRNETCGMETKFIVIQGRINSPPLLSRATLKELGMMEIRPDGSFAEPNDLKVTNEKTNEDADVMLVTENGKIEMTQILNEFESIFEGIGKIRDYRNDSELYVKFSMKPGIAPIAQKPRQVPYYLQEPLKQWLEEGVKSDIFEEVPSGTPVQWCSPLVVLPKPKFSEVDKDKLEPHMIRACVDMRIPNKFMERNRIIQSPVVEDFIYKFHKSSFNEGLSAGLFQRTEKGLQPVHFISRSMSDTEKRYSQTEKDALSIRWAKNRFSIYLLGAPKFKIITAHKPLIPMFNKTTIKLPPRIEKWVMDMQDVDFEIMYEPGKDEADPLDFLSRHPLPEKEHDETERVIKAVIHNEHAVILERLQEETNKDEHLIKLKDCILKTNWERNKKDMDIIPYYHMRNELYVAEGLVFRLNQIIVPKTLQEKVINAAHKMGHFGMTKTKQMLRERYWFPTMNAMVEENIKHCFECQVTTKQQGNEPLKMTEIPENPWEVVSVDLQITKQG